MALPQYVLVNAYQHTKISAIPIDIPVSAEYSFTLSINGNPFVSIVCSGGDLELLALGHLAAEGVILSAGEVRSIAVDEENFTIDVSTAGSEDLLERLFRVRSIASGCGQSGSGHQDTAVKPCADIPPVGASIITTAMVDFLHSSKIRKLTHGVHSAALYSLEGEQICFFDEIGRHSAIDKVLGYALRKGLSFDRVMVYSTGRIASEIVTKMIAVSAPVLVSRAAPTSLSVDLARRAGMLMIGGTRASGFYIYSGENAVTC